MAREREMQTDDQALVIELEGVRAPAQRCFEHLRDRTRLANEQPIPNLADLEKLVSASLMTHPRFRAGSSRFFGAKQLMAHPMMQARNLLRVSVERSPAAAVSWLHKVYSTEQTDVRYVAVAYGLQLNKVHTLNNGVSLMPLEALPPSENMRATYEQSQAFPGPLSRGFANQPFGATHVILAVRSSPSYEDACCDKRIQPRSYELERTIRAFTLLDGAAPFVGASWLEFVDQDLAMAEFGQMWMGSRHEGGVGFIQQTELKDADFDYVDRYLCTSKVSDRCDVAIERLNLARHRTSAGNRAIEGCICLEALLGDDDNTELTYKLRLRAALLLGADLAERRSIKKVVNNFYRLRSRTVHGRLRPHSNDEQDASEGLKICARALRRIVDLDHPPDFGDWELVGGKPM